MHDILPFSRYTNERLAPRIRSVLEGVFQAAWQVLEPTLQKALADYEQALFKRAEQARNHQEQTDQFMAMRELRKHSVAMQVAFRDSLQARLVALVASDKGRDKAEAASDKVLQLVPSEDLEESLILSELAAKAEMRFTGPWHQMGYRFAVIAARPPLDIETLPIGPHALADALKAAGRCLDLPVQARVDYYRFLELRLLSALESTLDAVTGDLIKHRILPHLHLPRRGPAGSAPAAASERAEDAPAPEAAEDQPSSAPSGDTAAPANAAQQSHAQQAPAHPEGAQLKRDEPAQLPGLDSYAAPAGAAAQAAGAAYPGPPPVPAAGAAAASPPAVPTSAGPALKALNQLWNEPQAGAQPTEAPMAGDDVDQSEMFTTLRELLSGRRSRSGKTSATPADRPVAPSADVQGVLSVLQGQPATPRMVEGRWQPRQVADIKHDVLTQLRALGDGKPARLAEEDEDTIDLVGLLFDQLGQGLSPVSLSHNLLTKLQVPVLKVALRDKRFFTQRKHPARLLLNEIAEAATLWVEDEDADKPMLDRMQLVVDRVIRDYDQNDGIFSSLLDDLGNHLKTVRRKADIAEKRQIDAARGREKMDLSRAAAVEATEQLLRLHDDVPEALRSFLLQAWTDVLALSLLRQGPHGEDFQHDLALAHRLLALHLDRVRPVAGRRSDFKALAQELAEGVGSVGMTPDAFAAVQSALSAALDLDGAEAPAPSSDALRQTLDARPRLGSQQATEEGSTTILSTLRGQEQWQMSPEEQRMVEKIKHLPFGSWIEFTRNQQGDMVRRKLSWYSPVTGRCLFVNARGAKVEDRTINSLARDLARGNARIVVQTRERLIDRAWNAILSAFQRKPDSAAAEGAA